MNKREMMSGVFCAVMAAAVALPALAQTPKQYSAEDIAKAKPSGTVTLDQEQINLIFGGSSGKGVLTFKGKTYPFTMKGGSAGASIGFTKTHGAGDVYFLNKIEDFTGKYSSAGAGAAAVKGVGTASYQNDKGVYLKLKQQTSGAELVLGIGVFDVQFVK